MPQTINQQLQQILDRLTGVESRLDSIEVRLDGTATKDDIKNMATKSDLSNLEQRMATKDDLKNLATKDDVKRLERKFDIHRQASIEHHLKIIADIGHLNQQFDRRFSTLRIVTE